MCVWCGEDGSSFCAGGGDSEEARAYSRPPAGPRLYPAQPRLARPRCTAPQRPCLAGPLRTRIPPVGPVDRAGTVTKSGWSGRSPAGHGSWRLGHGAATRHGRTATLDRGWAEWARRRRSSESGWHTARAGGLRRRGCGPAGAAPYTLSACCAGRCPCACQWRAGASRARLPNPSRPGIPGSG